MNQWQQIQQLAYLIRVETWADGGAEKVVSDAIESALSVQDLLGEVRLPFVVLRPGAQRADPESPDLIFCDYEMTLAVRVAGSKYARHALVGGPRTAGQGSSKGRGLLEVEEAVLGAVYRLTGANGMRSEVAYVSAVGAGLIDRTNFAFRTYTLRSTATRARYYHPPAQLGAVQAVSDVALTWKVPATRWDTWKVIVRRASGATAPATATAGTGITVGSNLATSATDTAPGSGTWSYAAFIAYDEKYDWKGGDSPDTAERYSAQETGTTATVTVS